MNEHEEVNVHANGCNGKFILKKLSVCVGIWCTNRLRTKEFDQTWTRMKAVLGTMPSFVIVPHISKNTHHSKVLTENDFLIMCYT